MTASCRARQDMRNISSTLFWNKSGPSVRVMWGEVSPLPSQRTHSVFECLCYSSFMTWENHLYLLAKVTSFVLVCFAAVIHSSTFAQIRFQFCKLNTLLGYVQQCNILIIFNYSFMAKHTDYCITFSQFKFFFCVKLVSFCTVEHLQSKQLWSNQMYLSCNHL